MTSQNETQQVLQMLADGKITVDEAHKLLDKLSSGPPVPVPPQTPQTPSAKAGPRTMHIDVREKDSNVVSIAVPLKLLKLGIGLPEHMPGGVKTKLSSQGINLDQISNLSDSEFYEAFSDLSINVDDPDDNSKVRIYCE